MLKKLFLNETLITIMVVLNTIVIFIGGLMHEDYVITVCDDVFTVLFTVEAFVKIRTLTWKTYWQSNWNRFDFFVLMLALPSVMNVFSADVMATNVVLACRSFRIFKALRLMKAVPRINELLNGIKMAIRSSLLVCIAFSITLLVVAILTTSLFGQYSPEHFGNNGISLYSIFRLFTIEGWYDLPDQIAANGSDVVGVLARIYFSVLLFAGGILGMSLINSIFVDAIVADNNDDVKQELEQMRRQLDTLEQMLRQQHDQKEGMNDSISAG